jgi:hypothetical protein
MKKLLSLLLRAVGALKLARCQQATKTETLDQNPICLLANREVNLLFVVQNNQFNFILEKDTNICFTNTDDYDKPREEGVDDGSATRS